MLQVTRQGQHQRTNAASVGYISCWSFLRCRKPSLEVAPTTLATFSFFDRELDLDSAEMNNRTECIG